MQNDKIKAKDMNFTFSTILLKKYIKYSKVKTNQHTQKYLLSHMMFFLHTKKLNKKKSSKL